MTQRKLWIDSTSRPCDHGSKIPWAHGGCLGAGRRRRTRQAAIVPGEEQASFDPGVSEWGNPPGAAPGRAGLRAGGATGGTETSKYPEEEKSTEIARVAASESARGPNRRVRHSLRAMPRRGCGARSPRTAVLGRGQKGGRQRNGMGRPAAAGDSPVREAPRPAHPGPRVGPGT